MHITQPSAQNIDFYCLFLYNLFIVLKWLQIIVKLPLQEVLQTSTASKNIGGRIRMNIAVCDNEKDSLRIIQNRIKKEFTEHKIQVSIDSYEDGSQLKQTIFSGNHYDVLFLDINMPGIDGIDLAKDIINVASDALIIFISFMDNYVYRSFEARPFRFIRKSHFNEEIPSVIHDIIKELEQRSSTGILLETIKDYIQINPYTTVYVECHNKTLDIYTLQKKIQIEYKLSDLEKHLAQYGFIRVHRGYLVNYRYIYRINKNDIILDDNTILPVSRLRRDEILKTFRRLTE
jgi:Response regulator of the LytR/AlgR family